MKKLKRILLVEDDQITNYINQKLIKKLNYADEIGIAQNGNEGLIFINESLKNNNCPELILLDINMPVMDGFEFLEEFQKLKIQENVVTVMLTTSSHIRDIEKIVKCGSTDFIPKPLTEEKLANIFAKYFNKSNI